MVALSVSYASHRLLLVHHLQTHIIFRFFFRQRSIPLAGLGKISSVFGSASSVANVLHCFFGLLVVLALKSRFRYLQVAWRFVQLLPLDS